MMIPNSLSELEAGACVRNWLVLGPFVVRTSEHFEREYMYERERILDIDYLEAEGGETAVRPVLGQSHVNIGLGPKRLAWTEYADQNLYGERIAGDIIYETVQRNCIVYAAARVDADRRCIALLDAYTSGMKVWANGELVCNMPYGIPKGVRTSMPTAPIKLRKGENLLLFKFRPGFICDGIDFQVRDVKVSPMAAGAGLNVAVGRVRPLAYFRGTPGKPRQLIDVSLLNLSKTSKTVPVSAESPTLRSRDAVEAVCAPGKVTSVRLLLATPARAAGKRVKAVVRAGLDGEAVEISFEYMAGTPPKHDGTVFVLSHFHFDTTYHEEQRVYAMGAFDIVRQYCRLHRADPLFRSIISEVDYLKPYFDVYPEDRETLLRVFRDGHCEPDVMYNQPNEQNCGDEALVRNFLYGQLIHGRVFGNICRVYGPGDVFGHPNQLSQIARKSGCIGVTWGKHIFNFPPFFDHLSLDGSALPHQRGRATEDDVHAMGLSVNEGSIDQTPPTAWHGDLLPAYKQGTFGDVMAAVRQECEEKGAHLPVTSRDMSLYHAATALSRVNLKIANRLGECLLLDAEKFATVANLLGARYPEKALDKAWRQLLCGQHHDSITGTHNEISYVDLMNAYRETLELGTDVLDRSLEYLGRAIESGGLTVFNPLAWERTDVVVREIRLGGVASFVIRDRKGNDVPFEARNVRRNRKGLIVCAEVTFVARKMPSLGYRVYRVVPAKKKLPEPVNVAGVAIANEFYRIAIDPRRGGGIASLYDKRAKREVINTEQGHAGNELAILEEVSYRNETQHEFYTTGLKLFSGDVPASVEIEEGPVSSTLRARYAMGELCGVVQEITLYKGVKRIEFRTVLRDWQREDYLYCITFPTNLEGCVPVFDERYGVVSRNPSKNYLDFRTHQMLMFSGCGVYAANKWTEYGHCALVEAGRGRYALGMVGLITPGEEAAIRVGEEIQRVLIKKGVTCTPWRDADGPHWGSYLDHMDEDLPYTGFRFSIGARGRNKYSSKLLAAQPPPVRRAFRQRVEKYGYACLLVKDAGLADTSWPPVPVLIVEAKSNARLGDAFDSLLSTFAANATIKLSAAANATGETHNVDDYGVAILNRGTYANSVEKGGTICMMLAHTCKWYGGTNNFPEGYLVPEHKNHAFVYALYPHAGDWREANTQRAGHEFNHPLIARQTTPGADASLPSEAALVKAGPKNVVLTAMKPFGNPMASFEKNKIPAASDGIMVRCYDTEGIDSEARVEFASKIVEAWDSNLLEEPGGRLPVKRGGVSFYVPPFSIETVGFRPGALGRKMGARKLGTEAEPVQPVWVRSWEHDAESLPMGYGSVVCSISREVEERDRGLALTIKVNAVNDYTDAAIDVEARLIVPGGWRTEPSGMAFHIAPLGHQMTDVTVRRPEASATGQIKLRYEYDGQTFLDVLEIGQAFDLEMSVENRGGAILVTLDNPTNETIEAEVSMVTPIETWPSRLVGGLALLDISPRTRGVSLAPGETTVLRYAVTRLADSELAPTDSYWAVAKLMCNGRIRLMRCGSRPGERRLNKHRWFERRRQQPGKSMSPDAPPD